MNTPEPPVLVCGDPEYLKGAAEEVSRMGWTVRLGFALPNEPWDLANRRWVCQGSVADVQDAEAATWALVRGCGLIVTVAPDAPPHFLADLNRAGRLSQFVPEADHRLPADEAALLAALAKGASLHEASTRLYLSERTAQRRLASARDRLGVRTTREAVMAWTRLSRRGAKGSTRHALDVPSSQRVGGEDPPAERSPAEAEDG